MAPDRPVCCYWSVEEAPSANRSSGLQANVYQSPAGWFAAETRFGCRQPQKLYIVWKVDREGGSMSLLNTRNEEAGASCRRFFSIAVLGSEILQRTRL